MRELLLHFFFPRSSNNHRAKILHHKSLLVFTLFFIFTTVLFANGKKTFPQVLGTSVDISVEKLLALTNEKRTGSRLPKLVLNEQLSQAAAQKVSDMFAKEYWAHNSPDGRTPWVFIRNAGYDYVYAGENLAKGFENSEEVVRAWMASQSHRENMLSTNYSEIGFAVGKGRLNGEETVLVVEMFGNRSKEVATRAPISPPVKQESLVASIKANPIINTNVLTRNVGIAVVLMFMFTLVIDMIIVERKKVARLVGHNVDHVFFLGIIFAMIILFGRGTVL